MNFDDPIVFPGRPGASHLHTFFGNTGTDASSTYESLRNTGNGTCDGGIANRSAYWVPSLLDAGGAPVVPTWSFQYYKSGQRSVAAASVNHLPDGLRIIAGDPKASSAQSPEIMAWWCGSSPGASAPSIPNCRAGDSLILGVTFPQCWDGVHVDSADHRSHMAYPTYGVGCPADHPVAVPVLTIHAEWLVPAAGFTGARLSSDMHSPGPGGLSGHADFFEGWNPAIRNTFTDRCVRAAMNCEVRALGDGTELASV
jgi:hypothetical protein